MDESNEFFWSISSPKKRCDVLSPSTKATMISWWVSKTRVNPNIKEQESIPIERKSKECG